MSCERLITGAVVFLTVCAARGLAEPPGDTNDWVSVPALTDEFNAATLDATRWHDHDPIWRGRQPVFFDSHCVTLTNGAARLLAKPHDDRPLPDGYTHRAGFIKARTPIRYGYFEIRAKLADTSLVSAFWLYQHTKAEWTEIDIFEAPAGVEGSRRNYHTNVHVFHSPTYQGTPKNHLTDSVLWQSPVDLAADYHVYALEWDAEVIRWFVDGQLIRERKNEHWHQPLFLCFNLEANGAFKALPQDDQLPAEYLVDHVRVWQRSPPQN